MDADVFKAILAMDSYNRGYGEGIKNLGNINTKIGNATFINQSNTDLNSSEFKAGFYASAYKLSSGETIISYRGTDIISSWFWSDNPGGDFWNGWATGLGDPANRQAELALKFYQAVAGAGVDPRTANISLTGHSLGGGLAGFVGDLYGKKGTLFNNMAFEVSAQNAHSYSSGTVVNPALKTLIYGSNPAWALNSQNLKTIYTDGEIRTGMKWLWNESVIAANDNAIAWRKAA